MYKSILSIIPTFLFFGYFPKIPGTIGTFGGVLFSIFLVDYLKIDPHAFLFTTIFIIILSVYSSNWAIKYFNSNDPKEVVIDEVAGFMVSILYIPFELRYIIVAFILFRLFDISKPFFVKSFEKLPKGWGITFDDVAAGVLANFLLQAMII
ncbi:MAG: phosphatidylglycerophosphatase A [bacterium]